MPSKQEPRPRAPETPSEELRQAMQGIMGTLMGRMRQTARAQGITMAQMFTLRRIQRGRQIPATSWARDAGLTPSSASSVVDGLVEAKLVRRARVTTDRRVVHLSLTPQGARVLKKLEEGQKLLWREMASGIPSEELWSAARLLRRLGESAPPVPAPPSRSGSARRSP